MNIFLSFFSDFKITMSNVKIEHPEFLSGENTGTSNQNEQIFNQSAENSEFENMLNDETNLFGDSEHNVHEGQNDDMNENADDEMEYIVPKCEMGIFLRICFKSL